MQIDRKWVSQNLGAGALQAVGGAIVAGFGLLALLLFGVLVSLWVSYGPGQPTMTRWDYVYITAFASLSALAVLWGLLALISKSNSVWRQFWGITPPTTKPELLSSMASVTDGDHISAKLCELAHLQRWHTDYAKHLNKAHAMQAEIEPLLNNKQLSPEHAELWQKWVSLQNDWSTALRATNHAYQQAFGEDKNLSLSLKWNIGQTPLEGASEMHPDAAAAKRHYYDQKDHLYREMPVMNRRFIGSIGEANEVIWKRGRELLHKGRN